MNSQFIDNTIKFATWNIRGITEKNDNKTNNLVNILNEEKINIAVVTETNKKYSGFKTVGENGYKMFYSGTHAVTSRSGVAIVLDATWSQRVMETINVNDKIMLIKLSYKCPKSQTNMLLLVIAIYAPTLKVCKEINNKFYADLTKLITTQYENEKQPCNLALMGDFNAWIGKIERPGITGKYGNSKPINCNGKKLIELADTSKLKITNTYFKSTIDYTFSNTQGNSLLDYIIVDHSLFNSVEETNILPSEETRKAMSTDHYLVYAVIKIKKDVNKE